MKEVNDYFLQLQQEISSLLQQMDGHTFTTTNWDYFAGGGGQTRVLRDGFIFRDVTVNARSITGKIPATTTQVLPFSQNKFYSSGIDVLVKPIDVLAPMIYCHFHYVELHNRFGDIQDAWFTACIALNATEPMPEASACIYRFLESALNVLDASVKQMPQPASAMFFLGGLNVELRRDFAKNFSCIKALGQITTEVYVPILEDYLDSTQAHKRVVLESQRQAKLEVLEV